MHTGGAVSARSGAEFINCLFDSNAAIGGIDIESDDCCSDTYGGAVWADARYWVQSNTTWEGGSTTFKNCTFVDNYVESKESDRSAYGAAISAGWDKDKKIYMLNTIIWGGRAIRGGSVWTDIDQDRLNVDIENGTNHKFIVNYSTIQNSTGTAHDDDNIYDIPPVFKDPDNDDFSLSDASPLIGAGIATWTSESITAPTKDILKVTRGTVPDIGAYENSLDASTAPLPVTGVTGVPVTNGAKLTWSANDASISSTTDATDIKRYEVFQDKSGTFTPVDSTTEIASTIKGLTHGTSYTFKVRAVNSSDVAGGFSDTVKVTPEFKGPKWYVSTSGVSTNEGSSTSPLSHLEGAIDKAASGLSLIHI